MRSRAFPGRLYHILNRLKINETVLNNEIEFVEEVLQGRVPRTAKIPVPFQSRSPDLPSGYYNQNDNDSVVFCHNDLKRGNIMKADSSIFNEKCKLANAILFSGP